MEINLYKSCGRGKPKGAEAAGEGWQGSVL